MPLQHQLLNRPTYTNPTLNVSENEFVTLGKVIGFFGVRGWVKVHSDTEPRENIVTYPRWWLGSENQRTVVDVKNGKRSGKNVVAKLAGIETREQAEAFLGKEIAVPRSSLPALSEDEFYWTDLVGCEVIDLNGSIIGTVERLFETGANEVIVARSAEGEEVLIPWIRPSVVTSVDLTLRRITVDWDPGFLES